MSDSTPSLTVANTPDIEMHTVSVTDQLVTETEEVLLQRLDTTQREEAPQKIGGASGEHLGPEL